MAASNGPLTTVTKTFRDDFLKQKLGIVWQFQALISGRGSSVGLLCHPEHRASRLVAAPMVENGCWGSVLHACIPGKRKGQAQGNGGLLG